MRGALRHAPRPARAAEPAALATEGDQFVVAAIGAVQAQEAVRQYAALQESVELVWRGKNCAASSRPVLPS